MLKYALRRTAALIPLVLLVMLVLFLILELMPYDAATAIAGETASPEQVQVLREELGLDQPWWERFWDSISGIAQGDLGESYTSGEDVASAIFRYLPTTLWLGAAGLFFAVVVGIPLGVRAALKPNGWFDRAVSAFAALTLATPPFVLGLVLVVVFALTWHWFPATGYTPMEEGIGEWLKSLVLPGIALGAIPAGELARHTRGAMIDVLDQDYVRTARAKGLLGRQVVLKHAAKNAAIPVMTMLGLIVGRLFAGAVTVEFVFGINGIGRLAYQAVQLRDIPMIQGIVLISAIAVLLVNLLVDLSYMYFNPRLRT